eukprot:36613-Rhodomonas_salina.1
MEQILLSAAPLRSPLSVCHCPRGKDCAGLRALWEALQGGVQSISAPPSNLSGPPSNLSSPPSNGQLSPNGVTLAVAALAYIAKQKSPFPCDWFASPKFPGGGPQTGS